MLLICTIVEGSHAAGLHHHRGGEVMLVKGVMLVGRTTAEGEL